MDVVSEQVPLDVVAVINPVVALIEQPDPTAYEKVPSEFVLGDVAFETTVAVPPYFKLFELYVVAFSVRDARLTVKTPFTAADGAV